MNAKRVSPPRQQQYEPKKSVDPPSWLDIAKYDQATSNWTPQQWGRAIFLRIDCAREKSASLWEQIKADPTSVPNYEVDTTASGGARCVNSLTLLQMHTLSSALAQTADTYEMSSLYGLPYEELLHNAFDLQSGYAEYGMAHVAVDLVAPTEEIVRDFRSWLRAARAKHKTLSDIDRDIKVWRKHKILAFADWQLFKTIEKTSDSWSNLDVARLLVGDKHAAGWLSDWLRRTAKPLHDKVFRETLALFLVSRK